MSDESIMGSNMAWDLLQSFKRTGGRAVSWTGGGEPTLWPHFTEITRYTNLLGLKQAVFTNGLGIPKYDPSLFEWIRVSNTDKPWNITVLDKLREKAKVLGLAVNYVGDDTAVERAEHVGKLVGVDYVQIRQALNLRGHVTHRQPPQPNWEKTFITSYKFEDSANPHGYSNCYGFNFVPFVWHNGDVDVCAYHRNKEKPWSKGKPYTLGNLLLDGGYEKIMAEAARSVPVCDSCQVCCKNHEINKEINAGLQVQNVEFV
jgi:MoaA/NifB/PqqE/SkfB family radical SAM enzyme